MSAAAASSLALAAEAAAMTEALWRPGAGPGAAQLLVSSVEALSLPGGQRRHSGRDETWRDVLSAASTPFPSPQHAALHARFDHASPPVRARLAKRTQRLHSG
jgi:hypothetical protein